MPRVDVSQERCRHEAWQRCRQGEHLCEVQCMACDGLCHAHMHMRTCIRAHAHAWHVRGMCMCMCMSCTCTCTCTCICLREVEDGGVDEHLVGVGVAVQRGRAPWRRPDRWPLRRQHGGGGGGGAVAWRPCPPHNHVGAWQSTGRARGRPSCGGPHPGFEWRPVTVEAEVCHAEAFLEHAPVSKTRWLSPSAS